MNDKSIFLDRPGPDALPGARSGVVPAGDLHACGSAKSGDTQQAARSKQCDQKQRRTSRAGQCASGQNWPANHFHNQSTDGKQRRQDDRQHELSDRAGFSSRVQSIGINASKQDAVLASIDRYDGRVVYIDALQAGGTATINFRLLTAAEEKAEKLASGETAASPHSSPSFSKCWWTSPTREAEFSSTPSRTRPPGQPRPQPPNHLCRP